MTKDGYVARWRGTDYDAAPGVDGEVRLYATEPAEGFTEMRPGRYMRVLRVETMDGIKFFLENPACAAKPNAAETWLLLRASGTEPLLRVYCESCTTESVAQVLEQARAFVLSGRTT